MLLADIHGEKSMQWLGLDYGKRYIGVAVGNDLTGLCEAVGTSPAFKGAPDWNALDRLVEDWAPAGFVLGYPLNMDGSTQTMSKHVLKFQENLRQRYARPCYLVDERLSSHQAKQTLNAKYNADDLNATAAQIILQQWFDEGMPKTQNPPS
jgi:putative Holliday junction resolvase